METFYEEKNFVTGVKRDRKENLRFSMTPKESEMISIPIQNWKSILISETNSGHGISIIFL